MIDPNASAFPEPEREYDQTTESYVFLDRGGLTKRELFAAMALNGILTNEETIRQGVLLTKSMSDPASLATFVSLLACAHADALIAALNKEPAK